MGKLVNNFRTLIEKRYGVTGEEARLPPQWKIAEDIGISQGAVSLWLAGGVTRFDQTAIERICRFLRCGVGDLLEYMPDAGERETA